MQIENFFSLCEVFGPAGEEKGVFQWIEKELSGHGVSITYDKVGNMHLYKPGKKPPPNKVLFTAHADEVSLMIQSADEMGFLLFGGSQSLTSRFAGNMMPTAICGTRLVVGKNHIPGVVCIKPISLQSEAEKNKPPFIDEMRLDIGAKTKEEALSLCPIGSLAIFDSDSYSFGNGRIKAKAVDDRIGCYLITEYCKQNLPFDFHAAILVQEELGCRGAHVAAYIQQPDIAVVLDATTAGDVGQVSGMQCITVQGEGGVISYIDGGTIYDYALTQKAFALARENGIKAQVKRMATGANDAKSIQRSGVGVRVISLSLPTRYIHSSACVAQLKDMEAMEKMIPLLHNQFAEE